MHPGKECGYDTDVHIPLIVRGPGVAAGRLTQAVTSHTDIAPTIMALAGQERSDFDGVSIPLTDEDTHAEKAYERSEHVNIEFWGMAIPEGIWGRYGDGNSDHGIVHAFRNNTYKGLRLIGEDYSLYYSVWCSGEKEYYDVKVCLPQL
jgi:N-acetylglucosamine-6-sulfatase